MDVYSTTFTLPRAAASVATEAHVTPYAPHDASSAGTSRISLAGLGGSGPGAMSDTSLPGQLPPPRAQPPAPSSGRMGSMRSRFPPSVKAFMPSAFGGSKRASERIAEASHGAERSEGEADDGDLASADADGASATPDDSSAVPGLSGEALAAMRGGGLTESITEEGPRPDGNGSPSQNRDSRSTAGTRSSVDFGSGASGSAGSTAPSTAPTGTKVGAGGTSTRATSDSTPSATHSANASMSTSAGVGPQQTGAELTEAMSRLASEAMGSHQCLVACAPVSQEESASAYRNGGSSEAAFVPFPGQNGHGAASPFPNSYPYQQYAQGFGHDAMASAFPSRMGMPMGPGSAASSMLGIGSPYGLSLGSTTSLHSTHSLGAVGAPPAPAPPAKPKAPQFNFHLSGGYTQVMSARGAILRDAPFRAKSVVKVPRADIIDAAPRPANASSAQPFAAADTMKPHVQARLDDIAGDTRVHISCAGAEAHGKDLGYGLETERNVELVISGSHEGVEQARVRVLVMLDELSGLHVETCEIDYKLHNIIGGRKRYVIQTIQEETGTSIYMPTPFSGILSSNRADAGLLARHNTIYICGEFFGVQRARDMLFQVSVHKSKCIISRDTAILPRKIDWMLTERLEELRSIMLDNGSFINLPLLGSQISVVSVYGDNRVSIERTIRSVMQLACQFYVASLWLLPVAYDAFMPSATFNSGQLAPALKKISTTSGAEVVFKSNCFELHGLENEVRSAVSLILDLDVVRAYNFEVRFQIELANEHREFISGKKNGKINKIMKQCGVRIKFETFNDYNFLIDVSGNDRVGALQGLAFLQEELPAEVSFHVPEAYHKRIIGVGGKSIQRIMKKYGVYVKFSNAEEFAALGGYVDNEDNVVARTPAKNAINLDNLKQAVMELVNPKDKDYATETVSIARRYHRTLLGEKGIFIHDIENKTSSAVRFPPKETASDLVSIFGPESQIHIAAQMLLDHVPFEAEFRTPNSVELAQLVASHDFVALTERVNRDLNVVIVPVVGAATTPSGEAPAAPTSGEAVFKLRLNRSNADFLPASKDALEDFLVSRNINVYDSPARARSDSFASSFPHFATKLISTAAESTDSFQPSEALRYQHERSRLRAAASTPDIKALFDSPQYGTVGHGAGGSMGHAHPYAPMPPMQASTNPTNSPLVSSSLYPSPYGETSNSSSLSSDVWAAPPLSTPGSAGGIVFPHHNARLSDDVGLIHRSGDGLAEEERVRALRKPRSFAHRAQANHRAQSLDISALAAQQAAQAMAAGAVPRPYGAIGSTPSVPAYFNYQQQQQAPLGSTNQFVPSHGPASSISRLPPATGAGPNHPDPSTMDEVSRVLAQLAFDRA